MKHWIAVSLLVLCALTAPVWGDGENLLPNGGFAGEKPFKGWLVDFPDEGFYKGNAAYIRMARPDEAAGRRAVALDLAAGIAGNQGGKIESEPVPAVPGGKYRVEVDCMTWDFSAKIHVEAWTTDPNPAQKRTIFRRAPAGGRPALIMCYRAQVPSPPGGSKVWNTATREFTVPETVVVSGKSQAPEFLTVKVVSYAATMAAGRSYFANFRLFRVNPASHDEKPAAKP